MLRINLYGSVAVSAMLISVLTLSSASASEISEQNQQQQSRQTVDSSTSYRTAWFLIDLLKNPADNNAAQKLKEIDPKLFSNLEQHITAAKSYHEELVKTETYKHVDGELTSVKEKSTNTNQSRKRLIEEAKNLLYSIADSHPYAARTMYKLYALGYQAKELNHDKVLENTLINSIKWKIKAGTKTGLTEDLDCALQIFNSCSKENILYLGNVCLERQFAGHALNIHKLLLNIDTNLAKELFNKLVQSEINDKYASTIIEFCLDNGHIEVAKNLLKKHQLYEWDLQSIFDKLRKNDQIDLLIEIHYATHENSLKKSSLTSQLTPIKETFKSYQHLKINNAPQKQLDQLGQIITRIYASNKSVEVALTYSEYLKLSSSPYDYASSLLVIAKQGSPHALFDLLKNSGNELFNSENMDSYHDLLDQCLQVLQNKLNKAVHALNMDRDFDSVPILLIQGYKFILSQAKSTEDCNAIQEKISNITNDYKITTEAITHHEAQENSDIIKTASCTYASFLLDLAKDGCAYSLLNLLKNSGNKLFYYENMNSYHDLLDQCLQALQNELHKAIQGLKIDRDMFSSSKIDRFPLLLIQGYESVLSHTKSTKDCDAIREKIINIINDHTETGSCLTTAITHLEALGNSDTMPTEKKVVWLKQLLTIYTEGHTDCGGRTYYKNKEKAIEIKSKLANL